VVKEKIAPTAKKEVKGDGDQRKDIVTRSQPLPEEPH